MSSAEEMPTSRRAIRGLPQPPDRGAAAGGTSPQPLEPTSASLVETGAVVADEVTQTPATEGTGQQQERSDAGGRTVPAETAQRDPRTFRVYRDLHAELTRLVREVEDRGLQSDRTELLHALLFYELPATADGAEKLVRRWRRAQAGA